MVITKPISKQLQFSIMTTISTQDHLKRMQIQRKAQKQSNKTHQSGQSTSTTSKQISNLQVFKESDIVATGALFEQPERLGFNHRRPTEVRSIPKYF